MKNIIYRFKNLLNINKELTKHETHLLDTADKIQSYSRHAVITGSLALRLKGYKLIHECDDLDLIFNNNLAELEIVEYMQKLSEQFGLSILSKKNTYNKRNQFYIFTCEFEGLKIHMMFVHNCNSDFESDMFEYMYGHYLILNKTSNILGNKIEHFLHKQNKKHLKQINVCVRQLNHKFQEKILKTSIYQTMDKQNMYPMTIDDIHELFESSENE